MKKCGKVKNPCMICLQAVTNKNGVQCKGACKKWAHFTCLNYTPGKIKDIKAGIITVTCPCPNCNTSPEVKEYLTDPPFTCNNQQCPANAEPKCDFQDCPVNRGNPIPQFVSRGNSPHSMSPCKSNCAVPKILNFPTTSPMKMKSPMRSPKRSQEPMPPCVVKSPPPDANTSCLPNSECLLTRNASTPVRLLSRNPSQRDVCYDNYTDNAAGTSPKSQSCSCLSGGEAGRVGGDVTEVCNEENITITLKSGDCKTSCSDSRLLSIQSKQNEKALLCTIHELCSTVGHLSNQIKDLMTKMITTLEKPC